MVNAGNGGSRRRGRSDFLSCKVLGLLAVFLLAASCLPQPVPTRPMRDGLSEIKVYLQPVPPEAGRLIWTLADLSVIRSDGIRLPLRLHADSYRGSDLEGRQTMMASGLVPPGSYSGLSVTFSQGFMKGEEENAALLVPEDPVAIKAAFELGSSEVLPLFISLDPAGLLDPGFAFSPDLSVAFPARELDSLTGYLVVPESDQITVFNRKTLQVVGAVGTGRDPRALAVDPARSRSYVAVAGNDTVEVIDVLGGGVKERIILRSGDEPVDLALSLDGFIMVTANYGSGTVSIIDPIEGLETDRLSVGRGPTSVTVNRSGTRAYVACSVSGTISVIDLTTGTLAATLSLGESSPRAAVLDGEEEKLFLIGDDSPNLQVIETAGLSLTDTIYIGTGPVSLAVDEVSGLVFVGRRSTREIAVVDPSVLLPVDFIELEGEPGSLIVDRQEKALLVVLPGKKTLQKVDLVNRRVLARMELDGTPQEVAVVQ